MTDVSPPPLIDALLTPNAYPHAAGKITLRETHISWVLLTGEFAYKIKKPVDLGFVDFTTLDRRRHFCEEELRLNRRLAPELYLDVVPIRESAGGLRFGDEGPAIEFAVRMRQFDEELLASRLLCANQLNSADIDRLATVVARFHDRATSVGEEPWGTANQAIAPARENVSQLRPLITEPSRLRQLDAICEWTVTSADRLSDTFEQRRHWGFVRECHGDLHLGNIVRWQGTMTPFDCIEFNPAFRWIDVMSEVAFLIMDLDDHKRADLSSRFLNTCLEQTGDYAGLSVLPFYLTYRAMVRAKVDALRMRQTGVSSSQQDQLNDEWHGYLDLAERYTQPRPVSLTITHGLSGSGKTTGTQSLLERQGAIRIRSDVERKRLCHLSAEDDGTAAVNQGIYSQQVSEQTYEHLKSLARQVITAGLPAIVDATFLQHAERERFAALAADLEVPFYIAEFSADADVLRRRIGQRRVDGLDASDATPDVLEHQLRILEPLTDAERHRVISPGVPNREPERGTDS